MEISYLGHASFKIKAKSGTIVTDPYGELVGWRMPAVSADIVTLSHAHDDHNNAGVVAGTSKASKPFLISEPGEYEIEGISIFGYRTWHDEKGGEERGENNIFVLQAEDIRILHLGDLGHQLSEKLIDELNGIDILMIPVGGVYTLNVQEAIKVIEAIDPLYVLPMHYRTERHDQKEFGGLQTAQEFVSAYGHTSRTVKSLVVSKISLPQDVTEVIVFE